MMLKDQQTDIAHDPSPCKALVWNPIHRSTNLFVIKAICSSSKLIPARSNIALCEEFSGISLREQSMLTRITMAIE